MSRRPSGGHSLVPATSARSAGGCTTSVRGRSIVAAITRAHSFGVVTGSHRLSRGNSSRGTSLVSKYGLDTSPNTTWRCHHLHGERRRRVLDEPPLPGAGSVHDGIGQTMPAAHLGGHGEHGVAVCCVEREGEDVTAGPGETVADGQKRVGPPGPR
jgi:hypothetical protein